MDETAGTRRSVADTLTETLERFLGEPLPVRFVFWDGSSTAPSGEVPGTVTFTRPEALRYIAWSPGELGLGRAFVSGAVDIDGDLLETLRVLDAAIGTTTGLGARLAVDAIRAAIRSRAVGPPPAPPPEEVHVRGRRHSKGRDEAAVTHHYDVGNDFYELVLGPSMTYSCARFVTPESSLEEAQAAKHDLVCRKLGLHEADGARLLDVGCGWGSMVIHAAREYGATAVGITLSPHQAEYAQKRVADAGLADAVEIRLQDYRDLGGERFDAISSIGMFEHVGEEQMAVYFTTLSSLLRPQGRLLNHAISRHGGSKMHGRSFIHRYVFPDGELLDVADVVKAMESAGLEVRDVESLREHYALTLRHWLANLESSFEQAVAASSEARARVWRLYIAASANNFDRGSIAIHQVLGVRRDETGASGMPLTRSDWR